MAWDVSLWCLQCDEGAGRLIGKVENVDSVRARSATVTNLEDVRNIMRQHEVEKHGGKSQ